MKKQLSPITTILILLIALGAIGASYYYWWNYMDKERGMSMAEAMEVDRKNAAARGEKPPPPRDPNLPKPKFVSPADLMNLSPEERARRSMPFGGGTEVKKKEDQKRKDVHDAAKKR